jgi:hypothetical protein
LNSTATNDDAGGGQLLPTVVEQTATSAGKITIAHAYADRLPHTITVTVTDNGALSGQATELMDRPTRTSVTSDRTVSSTYGQLVTFTAQVTASTGSPTGSVQFQVDGTDFAAPVSLVNGLARLATGMLSAGAQASRRSIPATAGISRTATTVPAPGSNSR